MTTMIQATYLRSTLGALFEGALIGSIAVFFPVNASTAFITTTFAVPMGVHTVLVTGLEPDTAYGVRILSSANGTVIVVNPTGTGVNTDHAGVLKVSSQAFES